MSQDPWRILLGFTVSIFVGHLIVALANAAMWSHAKKNVPGLTVFPKAGSLTWLLGMVERALYTGAFMLHAWEWVAVWLAAKAVAQWQAEKQRERPSDNIWLIGNALSIVCAFFGAWIALGARPTSQ